MKRLSTLVLLLFLQFTIITLIEAVATDVKCVSWNMQGSTCSGTQSKWTQVKNMLSPATGNQVIALQEAGELPSGATLTDDSHSSVFVDRHDDANRDLREYAWNIGTAGRPDEVYIYFYDMGNRVSLAIVSRMRASEMIMLSDNQHRRPLIGIQIFVENYYFSMHAGSHRGNEAPSHIIAIEEHMAGLLTQNGDITWLIMGDFNQTPDELRRHLTNDPAPAGIQRDIIQTGQPTHQGGNELDYAVAGRATGTGTSVVASMAVLMHHLSNHTAVNFVPNVCQRPPGG